ncbi:hypothetical protein [Streptomyces cavernicola]|uniref:DUF3558 domain-containing protein n=1 Tax=Streptomyces cavernicola TaxID=3043613 RepID=A0ABT6SGB5_9ACTN|nr:hypothetical protein [Streptomyces sp. B-S-A6]MDI3406463.1 hypothetical protein [Streptomyces sp. B-S-A6]
MRSNRCRATAAVGTLAALLVGCSGEASDWGYPIPKEFCGVETTQSTLKPLMPYGDAVEEFIRADVGVGPDVGKRCYLYIDREQYGNAKHVSIRQARETEKTDAVVEADRGLHYRNLDSVNLGGPVISAATGDEGALVVMRCKSPNAASAKYPYLVTEVTFGKWADKPKDPTARRDHLQAFLRDYIPATEAARCTQ